MPHVFSSLADAHSAFDGFAPFIQYSIYLRERGGAAEVAKYLSK